MRSFWFTLKIALLFALVMAVVLVGTFALFARVTGHGFLREIGRLRAHEGVVVAEQIEALLPAAALDGPEVRRILDRASAPWHLQMELLPADAAPPKVHGRHQGEQLKLEIRGRHCVLYGPPVFETRVPIRESARVVAWVAVRGPLHQPQAHGEFLLGIVKIGVLALAGIAALALILTAPLRRMARSMDLIAAGELEHRVPAAGHDEVARVGQSFNRMADRIQHMIIGQKELMAGVSHELRSPLARIKLHLELLREQGFDAARVDELEHEADALNELVDEILVASRLELGETPLQLEELCLGELLDEAWQRVGDEARALGMELLLNPEQATWTLWADRALLVRALGNLFENAVRYAARGKVLVEATRREGTLELVVEDRGPGVDEDHLERLFEPFYRADASRSRKTGASGLGLMIVRRAVEAHGGLVRAVRGEHGGLRIEMLLPHRPRATAARSD